MIDSLARAHSTHFASSSFEATVPVEARPLRERLWEILQIELQDHRQAWDMRPDGTYALRDAGGLDPEDPRLEGTHAALMRLTRERFEGD